ncbi:DUF4179 domain-containing protein [Clostridium sp. AL.422]|uniref:DUF4179 domain-containing protein n=1 Tax=Clostridium TaxID=1485 RepID=UPI00293DD5BF|nr:MULTISPECIES: DUF4179 domain-containing protein [unclassified Clostridium]MDV4151062.1 DUF4179 domain-containing protein [Clostridium sp. AL.422]
MMDLDKELKNLKEDKLNAPPGFENLMREALVSAERDKKKKFNLNNKYIKVAILFISFLFIINISTVSAMIKKLIGYDEYFSYYSYVEKLNENGELQEVNQKVSFSNGKEITIEAIVYDNKYTAVFIREKITKEYGEEANIEAIDGKTTGVIGVYGGNAENGEYLRVERFKIGENKEDLTLSITEEGERKEITIDIDESKIVKVKNIKPEDNEIEIDGVKFVVNSLRVSPLAINLDYSLVSEDAEKVKAIQLNNGDFFSEGIYFMPIIEGRNIEAMGVLSFDERENLSNGIRLVKNFVLKDLAIDKFNNAKIIIQRANFSEDLNLDMKSNVNDIKINDNLFIEELKYNEGMKTVDIAYWSKYKKKWSYKYLYYEILPYDGYISFEPSAHKSNIKEYLGKYYREYEFNRRQLYIGEGKKFFIVNDKAIDISKKDRTIKVKIDY